MADEQIAGCVVRLEGGFYTVQPDTLVTDLATPSTVLCTLPGRLRRGPRTATNPLAIGDRVTIVRRTATDGVIVDMLPRRSEFARQAAGNVLQKHVLVANIDLVVIVVALVEPPVNLPRIDRMLVACEQMGVPAMIALTKCDLGGQADLDAIAQMYVPLSYPLIVTSARTGDGIATLRQALQGRLSAVIGVSGVGKSSLLNALHPGLHLKYGDLSLSTGKGKHTTTVAELHALPDGGYVADTPGLRVIAPWDMHPDDLAQCFPEMRPLIGSCRFRDCTHRTEDGCAILQAASAGTIAAARHISYRKLYDESAHALRQARFSR